MSSEKFVALLCIQDNFIQSRVSAEVLDPKTGLMTVTNVFHFTFLAKEKTPPLIVPKTYHEVFIMFLYIILREVFVMKSSLTLDIAQMQALFLSFRKIF